MLFQLLYENCPEANFLLTSISFVQTKFWLYVKFFHWNLLTLNLTSCWSLLFTVQKFLWKKNQLSLLSTLLMILISDQQALYWKASHGQAKRPSIWPRWDCSPIPPSSSTLNTMMSLQDYCHQNWISGEWREINALKRKGRRRKRHRKRGLVTLSEMSHCSCLKKCACSIEDV